MLRKRFVPGLPDLRSRHASQEFYWCICVRNDKLECLQNGDYCRQKRVQARTLTFVFLLILFLIIHAIFTHMRCTIAHCLHAPSCPFCWQTSYVAPVASRTRKALKSFFHFNKSEYNSTRNHKNITFIHQRTNLRPHWRNVNPSTL